MSTSLQTSINTIEQFLASVGGSVKRAEANTEAGGYQEGTSHPVKDVDDRTEVAKEGDRGAENSKDVKEDQGPAGVNSAAVAKSARDILAGLAKSAAMPAFIAKKMEEKEEHKKDEKKAELKGDQHKIDANKNNKIDGEDFKMLRNKKAESAVSTPGSAADDQIQIGTNKQPTGEDPSNETNSAKAGKKDPGSDHPARSDNSSLDGHKYASASLEKLASSLHECGNQLVAQIAHLAWTAKKAEEEGPHGEEHEKKETSEEEKAEHSKQAADPELVQLVGRDLANVMANKQATDAMVYESLNGIVKTASLKGDLLSEYLIGHIMGLQKQAEGDMMQEAMTADAPPASAGGGLPMGGGDEAAMAAMGGGGEGGDDSEIAQLAQVLDQMGVTPEDLEQAMAQEGGEGEGAGEEPAAPPATPEKMSADKRAEMNNYVSEVLKRSRKR